MRFNQCLLPETLKMGHDLSQLRVRGNSADQLGRVSSEWDSMRVLKEGNRNKRDKKELEVAM
jgi:hypothetical protein